MHKYLSMFISIGVCLIIASQALAYQQAACSRQSDDQELQSTEIPGVLMLLLADDPEKHELKINITGQGQGQVYVAPDRIKYDPGTVVTLTAEAGQGSVFTTWSGACSGSNLICKVTMDQDQEVSADFALDQHEIPGMPFRTGDSFFYDVRVEMLEHTVLESLYQWEVLNISSQKVILREISKLMTSEPFGEVTDDSLDFSDFFEGHEFGTEEYFSAWGISDRRNLGYSLSEHDYLFVNPEDALAVLWIPTNITDGDELVIGDLSFVAQGPVTKTLPGMNSSVDAWRLEKELDWVTMTFYYDFDKGFLLSLRIEDNRLAGNDLLIEMNFNGETSSFQKDMKKFSDKTTVSVKAQTHSDETQLPRGAEYQRQASPCTRLQIEPPFSFYDAAPKTVLRASSDMWLKYPWLEEPYFLMDGAGNYSYGVRTRPFIGNASGWYSVRGVYADRIFVCGQEGEKGNYKVTFHGIADVEAEIESSDSTPGLGEIKKFYKLLKEGLKNLRKLIPKAIVLGASEAQIRGGVVGYDQSDPPEVEQRLIRVISGNWWNSSDEYDGEFVLSLDVELEGNNFYNLEFVLEAILNLSVAGLTSMQGYMSGDVQLEKITIHWHEDDPHVVLVDEGFDPDNSCRKLEFDCIPDQMVMEPFEVTVNLKTQEDCLETLLEDSNLTLSVAEGIGNLMGEVSKILPAGESQVIFEDLIYDEDDEGVVLEVEGSGELAGLKPQLSDPFNVGGAAYISWEGYIDGYIAKYDVWNCSGLEGEWQMEIWQEVPYFPDKDLVISGEATFTMPARPETGDWESLPFSYTISGVGFYEDIMVEIIREENNVVHTIIESDNGQTFMHAQGEAQQTATVYHPGGIEVSTDTRTWETEPMAVSFGAYHMCE